MHPRRRKTDREEIRPSFAWLVVLTLALEGLALLWLTGALRPLSAT